MCSRFLAPLIVVLIAGCNTDTGPKSPSTADLSTMLQDPNPDVQREAAHWVIQQGPKAAETTPALAVALKSKDKSVRISAAVALGRVGPDAVKAVPALIVALADSDISVRQSAAETLGKIGPPASSAVPALEKVATESVKCNTAPIALKLIRQ